MTGRKASYPITPLILDRWSPRSMTGEALKEEEFMPLFEAARWAPSCYNEQPWKILYAKRDTPEWEIFYNLLIDFNRQWCEKAAVLVVFASSEIFAKNGKPNRTHSYDAGAAWMNMALEGSARGLVVHGMVGFDYEKAKQDLKIPEGYTVEAMAAIGKPAAKDELPKEMMEKEKPSDRKPLNEVAKEGPFKG